MSLSAEFYNTLYDPALIGPALLTVKVVLATLLLHVFLGALLGWALAARKWPGRTLVDIMVTLPLIFPPMALGFFLLLLFGRNGFLGHWLDFLFGINIIFSVKGIILASAIAGLPLVVKPIEAAIRHLPPSLKEASYTLGHGEIATFFYVILPNIKGAFLTSLVLGTARAIGEVGITLMLGGNIIGRTNTISLEIYNAVSNADYQRAFVLSLLLAIVSMLILFILGRLTRSSAHRL